MKNENEISINLNECETCEHLKFTANVTDYCTGEVFDWKNELEIIGTGPHTITLSISTIGPTKVSTCKTVNVTSKCQEPYNIIDGYCGLYPKCNNSDQEYCPYAIYCFSDDYDDDVDDCFNGIPACTYYNDNISVGLCAICPSVFVIFSDFVLQTMNDYIYLYDLFASPCSVFNLDFTPFLGNYSLCIAPHMSPLGAISFWYVVGFYPLLLLLLLYVWITLYDKGYKCVVLVTRPFHRCMARFWSMTGIEPFFTHSIASIYILCFTPLAITSFQILRFRLNDNGFSFFYDAKQPYFGGIYHIMAGIFAILVLLFVILLPTLYMLLYSFKWFHKLLDCLHLRKQLLISLGDVFTGPYKNGTNGTVQEQENQPLAVDDDWIADRMENPQEYDEQHVPVRLDDLSVEHSQDNTVAANYAICAISDLSIIMFSVAIFLLFLSPVLSAAADIYVSSSDGINNTSCWTGGVQTPCATLDLAIQGAATAVQEKRGGGVVQSNGCECLKFTASVTDCGGEVFDWRNDLKRHYYTIRIQEQEDQPLIGNDDDWIADRVENPHEYDEQHVRVRLDDLSVQYDPQDNTVAANYGSINTNSSL
uniref:Uncharacterized protein n=1 Tax=Amphimedon queenslandica TaxID=400682 RepID=A0A1X7U7K0_AMPQE